MGGVGNLEIREPSVPSFKGLHPASPVSSLCKRHNRRCNTEHEVVLRNVLWKMGVRYRKNDATLPGRPDLVMVRARVVVFCDGDFWHGRDWELRKARLAQ